MFDESLNEVNFTLSREFPFWKPKISEIGFIVTLVCIFSRGNFQEEEKDERNQHLRITEGSFKWKSHGWSPSTSTLSKSLKLWHECKVCETYRSSSSFGFFSNWSKNGTLEESNLTSEIFHCELSNKSLRRLELKLSHHLVCWRFISRQSPRNLWIRLQTMASIHSCSEPWLIRLHFTH